MKDKNTWVYMLGMCNYPGVRKSKCPYFDVALQFLQPIDKLQ